MRLGRLTGCLPQFENATPSHTSSGDDRTALPVEVQLEFYLALEGHILEGPIESTYAVADAGGAAWGQGDESELILLAVKVPTSPGMHCSLKLLRTCSSRSQSQPELPRCQKIASSGRLRQASAAYV